MQVFLLIIASCVVLDLLLSSGVFDPTKKLRCRPERCDVRVPVRNWSMDSRAVTITTCGYGEYTTVRIMQVIHKI